jgi:hypothetical protein
MQLRLHLLLAGRMTARTPDVGGIATVGRIAIRAARRIRQWNLAQACEVIAAFAIATHTSHQRSIRVVVEPLLRLPAATTPMIPTTTTAPTTIHVHGTSVVVVLVDFSVVDDEPGAAGADIVPDPDPEPALEPEPEPLVVVVEPFVVVLCANVIAGAMRRKRARSIKLRRKIGRM